jgi:hypothetical protein
MMFQSIGCWSEISMSVLWKGETDPGTAIGVLTCPDKSAMASIVDSRDDLRWQSELSSSIGAYLRSSCLLLEAFESRQLLCAETPAYLRCNTTDVSGKAGKMVYDKAYIYCRKAVQ